MRPRACVLILAAATLVRVAALPLPGTEDVGSWKIWSHAAARDVTTVYGVGGDPPTRGVVQWGERHTTVDYPPVALYELALVGLVYERVSPGFPDGWQLVAWLKLPGLLAGAGLTALLFTAVRRLTGQLAPAQWVAVGFWANPATVLNAEVLGYLDPLMMLPAVAALVLASSGWPTLAGASLALAVLTKPQGILVAPALGLLAWHRGSLRGLLRMSLGVTTAASVALLPFALAGALPNMWLAFGAFYARRDTLAGYAANFWWIVTWALRAWYSVGTFGFPKAFLLPVRRILAVSRVRELGFPNPRPFGTVATLAACGLMAWRVRRASDLAVLAGFAAFTVHAFFVLSVGVHEHHLVLAVPLLALAAALRVSLRPVFYAVSAIVFFNLNVFYGISPGWGWAVPRTLTPVDLSVLLALANCIALVWHGRVLAREARASWKGAAAIV